jgi:hypothetical protein
MTVTAFPDSNLNDLHHSVINQQLSGEILHLAQKSEPVMEIGVGRTSF